MLRTGLAFLTQVFERVRSTPCSKSLAQFCIALFLTLDRLDCRKFGEAIPDLDFCERVDTFECARLGSSFRLSCGC